MKITEKRHFILDLRVIKQKPGLGIYLGCSRGSDEGDPSGLEL